MLYINGTAFASLAQVLAIAETREVNDRDNLLSVQPGSVFYHTLEFCNVAHKCERVVTQPGIVIRECQLLVYGGRRVIFQSAQ